MKPSGASTEIAQPALDRLKSYLIGTVVTPDSWYEYSCPAKVNLVNFRAPACSTISGTMTTIALHVTSGSVPGLPPRTRGDAAAGPRSRFGLAMPGEKIERKWRQNNGVDVISLLIEPNEALDWLEQYRGDLTAQAAVVEDFAVNTIRSINENLGLDKYFGRLFAESATTSLLHHMRIRFRGHAGNGFARCGARDIAAAVDFIHARFHDPITLCDIAAASPLSTARFIHAFKQHTGLTPHQYVLRLRVARAKELLARNDLGLGVIALESGFYDQSRLTTVFRKITGVTPGKFRKSLA